MTSTAVDKLRLSCPADLVEAVPYLLGFHPSDSLVALALRGARRRVVFSMRLDLPAAEGVDVARCVRTYLGNAKAEQAVLVAYGTPAVPGQPLPHAGLVAAVTAALAGRRIEVVEALHVGAGRWWSHLCRNPVCCPPAGTPLAARTGSTVAATATYAGMVALPSRQALEDSLKPIGFIAAAGMERALARAAEDLTSRCAGHGAAESVRAESLALLSAAVDGCAALCDTEVARLVVGLHDIAVRDACLDWATTDRADAARRLWTTLACRTMPPWSSVPVFLVGWFAYLAGDATLASIAVDRCLAGDPDYGFALLLREALQRAIDPAVFRDGQPLSR